MQRVLPSVDELPGLVQKLKVPDYEVLAHEVVPLFRGDRPIFYSVIPTDEVKKPTKCNLKAMGYLRIAIREIEREYFVEGLRNGGEIYTNNDWNILGKLIGVIQGCKIGRLTTTVLLYEMADDPTSILQMWALPTEEIN